MCTERKGALDKTMTKRKKFRHKKNGKFSHREKRRKLEMDTREKRNRNRRK
jgi:hypothetical protein